MSRSNHIRLASFVLDLACIAGALSAAGIWAGTEGQPPGRNLAVGSAHIAIFAVIWSLIASRLGIYYVPSYRNRAQSLRRATETWATTWGVAGLLTVSTIAPAHFHIWLALAVGLAGLLGVRLLLSASRAASRGRPRTIVLGACNSARSISSGEEAQATMEFVGAIPFSGENPQEMPHLRQLGTVADLPQILREEPIDLALVCPSDRAVTGEVHKVFQTCDEVGLGIQYFPSFLDLQHLQVGMVWNANRPGLTLNTPPNQSLSQLAKRAVDLVGASIGLLALLPVFTGCALAVKFTSRGPVFFRQTRVGKNGETFTCFKFRTMRVGAHAQQELLRSASIQDGPAFKIPKDPRITPFGRILRKFSLDELPQLLNVLLGDMSIVGPRPPIPSEVEKYTWWQRRRISVKPGLTCVWQVWGRNRVSFKRWVEMDLYYIDNWSLWLDLKLIAHTFRTVVSGTGM